MTDKLTKNIKGANKMYTRGQNVPWWMLNMHSLDALTFTFQRNKAILKYGFLGAILRHKARITHTHRSNTQFYKHLLGELDKRG